jgi:hypothetical protein
MMISREHFQQAEAQLRSLVEAGSSLGDALRVLHHERQIGTMLLWPAVMSIRQVDKQEALRIVVHETAPWHSHGETSS